ISDALLRLRLSTQRGSAYDGEPSGIRMSQNMRATPGYSPRHGSSWNVDGSGLAIMSASCTRAKPSIADPSKPMPSANAPSSSAGATATDLSAPSTSVNQSRTNRMSRSSSVRSTNSSCLSTAITLDVSREHFTSGWSGHASSGHTRHAFPSGYVPVIVAPHQRGAVNAAPSTQRRQRTYDSHTSVTVSGHFVPSVAVSQYP